MHVNGGLALARYSPNSRAWLVLMTSRSFLRGHRVRPQKRERTVLTCEQE